ncbi:transcriptional regulator with XRE-family HTH domain [Saccharothrix ecbatanensis]|uniref:Transcriptional regulator with XRE-family HTH domain n=1 Tax=Saccharothrix ecbatanensis TaxID=1105145 RepID=A0A7W9HDV5_9PSEU|nr:helix-turn-helix transcriptional regulator [Saccharothrix ecbatanensis]MBB5800400.1 transcriptional regulator with XRE-family HTH domain [Saccharothrix ecbatanensis]
MVRSTPKAMALGALIKAGREAVEPPLSQRALERQVGLGVGAMSRIESGERPPDVELTAALLGALGVTGPDRERALALAREEPDDASLAWLAVDLPGQRQQLHALLKIEQLAGAIVDISPLVVPGLLQVGGYARSIMRRGGVPDDEIETRVAIRMGRRDVLTRSAPVQFTAAIGAGVFRQRFGGPAVMREQLEHLLKMAQLPNVELRAVPTDDEWNPALAGAFSLITISAAKSVVHLENQTSGLFLEQPEEIAAFDRAATEALNVAMSADQTSALIDDALRQID